MCTQEAASEPGTSVFADQFENAANFRAHLKTGEEIWQQTGGALDAFVSGAGTGGTIAGVSHQLKSRNPSVQVLVLDAWRWSAEICLRGVMLLQSKYLGLLDC